MKVKIEAGAELDFLTNSELATELDKRDRHHAAGFRFPRPVITGTADGSQNLLAGTVGPRLGPDAGFLWNVRAMSVAGFHAGESVAVYVNDTGPSSFVGYITANPGFGMFEDKALVLTAADSIIVVGAGLTIGQVYTIIARPVEVPTYMAHLL